MVSRRPPRTTLGKAADVGILVSSSAGSSVPWPPRPRRQGGQPPAEHADDIVKARGHSDDAGWAHQFRPDSPTASTLMKELVCLCGGCKRENLHDCKCGYAAQERQKVLKMLAAHDLTTDKGRVEARRAVIGSFVQRVRRRARAGGAAFERDLDPAVPRRRRRPGPHRLRRAWAGEARRRRPAAVVSAGGGATPTRYDETTR